MGWSVRDEEGKTKTKARGLEEQIEEALTASSSFSEQDFEDMDMDLQVAGSLSSSSSCCGSHCEDLEEPQVTQNLRRVFDALRLTDYAGYVKERIGFTVASGVLLVLAGLLSYVGGNGVAGAAQNVLWSRLGRACLCSVYGILGVPALLDLSYNLVAFRINIHVLTMLAVFGTVVIGSPLEGALLLVLFEFAHAVEDKLTSAARGDLTSLLESTPKVAVTVSVNQADYSPKYDTEKSVRVESVSPGKYVVVKAGDIVPLDGTIVYGKSLITSENITGESLPYTKVVGDCIPAGARSVDGTIVLRTLKNVEESTPMRILKLTKAAQIKKPGISMFLDSWLDMYSKAVLVCTLAVSLALPLVGVPVLGTNGSVYRAAAFLAAAAPCALVMTPLAYISAISAIARRGVIVRGGKVIDALSSCDTVALDKTGTLTEGKLECIGITRIPSSNGLSEPHMMSPLEDTESLSLALAVSQGSTHPISRAVKKCSARAEAQNGFKTQDFRMIPGHGVEAVVENGERNYKLQFGSIDYVSKYLSEASSRQLDSLVEASGKDKVIAVLHAQPQSRGEAQSQGEMTSLFFFTDKVRSASATAVDTLQSVYKGKRLDVLMLTGDREANAMHVADKLGIKKVYASLLPEDKVRYVEEMRSDVSKSGHIAFVGDGINDAPALATADVGIAFANSTTAAAASAADVIVLKEGGDHISSLPYIFRVARKTKTIIKQNLILAVVSIVAATLPSVAGKFPLWLSVSIHEGSTLLVALNSLRCLLPESKWWVGAALLVTALMVPGFYFSKVMQIGVSLSQLGLGLSLGGLALMLESASAGLFAGALHSLTGPDHLAALAPLSMGRTTLAAGFLGGLWGFGHSMGQLFFGALFILLKSKLTLQLDLIENFAGAAVGLTLIAIGYVGYKEAKNFNFDRMRKEGGKKGKVLSKFSLATFGTGFLHGLSPDAIFPILPAITMNTKACAFAFVVSFLFGTIASMASYTAFIGVGSSALAQKSPDITRKVSMGSSFVAVFLGVALVLSAIFGIDLLQMGGH
ncbi:heavy metal transporting ATPase [Chloropicon primus]|nr:heavy metal transporting ATPase [Chloropicon primus]UPR02826.1 heavy metal transporting ATPase [Chloropicon primus]|eukprot:QDZ23613.1 heavy metal transporting ATPase [Chloropicon primus]